MNNSKIVCILGAAATGKDTLARILCQDNNVHKVTSYTTRPKRTGETDEYYFVDKNEFDRHEFIEKTSYSVLNDVYEYGFARDEFKNDKANIVIVNPRGIKAFFDIDEFKDRLVLVLLKASLDERRRRYLGREALDKNAEARLEKRLIQDEIDFNDEEFLSLVENNTSFVYKTDEMTPEEITDDIIKKLKELS